MIFKEEHFTCDWPHYDEVNQFIKYSTSPAVLTDLFPNQETHMVSRDPSSSNTVLMLSSLKSRSDVLVATQNKDYGNLNPSNGQATNQPSSLAPS